MALATFSGLAKGLMVHAALQQLLEAGVIDASSNTQPLVGYYGHRDGAIGAMLAAAMLKVTYGADPQFLVSTTAVACCCCAVLGPPQSYDWATEGHPAMTMAWGDGCVLPAGCTGASQLETNRAAPILPPNLTGP